MTMERMEVFRTVAEARTDEIVVMTMTASLQWPLVSDDDLDFDFLAFGMGHASDFATGLAMARAERKTIVWKGDGGLLMSLGSLVTLGAYGPENLVVFLLENRSYEMTGGQPLPDRPDFIALARAAGVDGGGTTERGSVELISTVPALETALPRILTEPGPHFIVLPVHTDHDLPPVAHTDHTERVTKLRRALGLA